MNLPPHGRWLIASAGLAVAVAGLLMAIRMESAISFVRPLLLVTSGAEEEGVLGILRAMEGDPYVDPTKIPFAATYYNWLFFAFFSSSIQAVQGWLGLSVEWVPTIGRFVGLCGALLCWITASQALNQVTPPSSSPIRFHNWILAAWLAIGPLTGWWAISINPELWATGLSQAAILVVLLGYGRRPLTVIALASLLSVAAWSFKHSYLFVALALGMFLLFRKDWKGIIVLGAIHLAGIVIPQAIGSPLYQEMMLAWRGSNFAMWQLIRNVTNVTTKELPIIIAAIVTIISISRRWKSILSDTPLLISLCGLFATGAIVPATAKVGAAENYYFIMIFFLALLASRSLTFLDEKAWPKIITFVLTLAWSFEAIASASVVMGFKGTLSVRAMDTKYRAQQACTRNLPSPMFSLDPYLQLPWMHSEGPRFILAYQYAMEREQGRKFERDGIGGLIREKYFASIATTKGATPKIDGVDLDGYILRESCADLDLYYKK